MSTPAADSASRTRWRGTLQRHLTLLLLLKLAALALLWVLFFSSAHRPPAGSREVGARLAAAPPEVPGEAHGD